MKRNGYMALLAVGLSVALLGGCPGPVAGLDGPWTWIADEGVQPVCFTFSGGQVTYISLLCDGVNDLVAPADIHVTATGVAFSYSFVATGIVNGQATGTFTGSFIDDNTIRGTLSVNLPGSTTTLAAAGTFTRG